MSRGEQRFGRYRPSYGTPFTGYVRRSLYLPMSDGVRLALDYFLPAVDGEPTAKPVPVVFQMTPYNRAQVVDGTLTHVLSPYRDEQGGAHFNNLEHLCRHGYAIAALDVRGQGASFGSYDGVMSAEEGRDGAEAIAWLAAQPWCTGAVGMLGSSYGAATQFLVAAEHPPALKALYPAHIYLDAYDVHFPGGARDLSIPRAWTAMVDVLAGRTAKVTAAPVDGPEGPALLAEVMRARAAGTSTIKGFERTLGSEFRDGNGYFIERTDTGPQNLATLLPALRSAAIPAYFHGGWNDYYPAQTILWFANWTMAPAKMAIGPWTHSPRAFSSPRDDEDLRIRAVESLRWFDHWLKGIDTGMLDEPAINYAIQEGHPYNEWRTARPDRWEWRSTACWPPANIEEKTFYLVGGRSGTIGSTNDGCLSASFDPVRVDATLVVDPAVSTGPRNRMGAGFLGVAVALPDMAAIDARCLTWTSEPFQTSVEIVGSAHLELQVSASVADVVLVIWLEGVEEDGRSMLLTYGALKASHRALGRSPYTAPAKEYLASTRAAAGAAAPLHERPARIDIPLLPTANRILAGQRLRISLSGADEGNLEGTASGATIVVHLDKISARLKLPVAPD